MTKKTKIYIGVGAGILLLGYLYLKRKQNQAVKMLEEQQGEVLEEGVEERGVTPSGGGGGGSVGGGSATPIPTPSLFAPLTALVTPVAVGTTPITTIGSGAGGRPLPPDSIAVTTPSRTDVTNLGTGITIPSLNPTATIKPTFSPANIGKPTTSPINFSKPTTSPINFSKPTTSPIIVSKPLTSPVAPRVTTTVVAPVKAVAFDGTNNECFETGHCLTDL